MNYTEITELAISISDRTDTDTANRLDDFIRIIESRINRKLKTMNMSTTIDIPTVTGDELYDLPSDFGGLREIKFKNSTGGVSTMHYATPQSMDGLQGVDTARTYYTIIGLKLKISPTKETGNDIEITYYQKLPKLTSLNTTNWLSESDPDCYVFGLLVEISAFAKDAEAKLLWDDRFKETISEIDFEDSSNRWSGTPLETRVG